MKKETPAQRTERGFRFLVVEVSAVNQKNAVPKGDLMQWSKITVSAA
jgi:hypothetical protein